MAAPSPTSVLAKDLVVSLKHRKPTSTQSQWQSQRQLSAPRKNCLSHALLMSAQATGTVIRRTFATIILPRVRIAHNVNAVVDECPLVEVGPSWNWEVSNFQRTVQSFLCSLTSCVSFVGGNSRLAPVPSSFVAGVIMERRFLNRGTPRMYLDCESENSKGQHVSPVSPK